MAKDILAVYDPCRGYVERFIKYVSEKDNTGYEIQGYTDLDILEERLHDYRIKAVLLFGEEIDLERRKRIGKLLTQSSIERGKYIFLLGEQPYAGEEENGFCHICKYQSMEKILEDVSAHIRKHEKNETSGPLYKKPDLQIYGIYSPWDKMSHPEAAAHIAAMIRKQARSNDVRILYMNLEPFSGMSAFVDQPENMGISDIIYCFRTRPDHLREAVNAARGRYAGMDVLAAPEDPEDLDAIGKEHWPEFLESISRAGNYQYIILDMSDLLVQLLETVLIYGSLFVPALPHSGDEEQNSSDKRLNISEKESIICAREEMLRNKMKEFRKYIKAARSKAELEKIFEIRADADRRP